MLKLLNILRSCTVLLMSLIASTQNFQQIGDAINEESPGDAWGHSISLSADGNTVAIGAPTNNGNGIRSGHVRVYQNLDGTWQQIGDDIDGETAQDGSGFSVCLSGDGHTVAIGAPGAKGTNPDEGAKGHVRIYRNINNTWVQIGQDLDGYHFADGYGTTVSLNFDGNVVAIKSNHHFSSGIFRSYLRVFKNTRGIWSQVAHDIGGDAVGNSTNNSLSLSANGNIIASGEPAAILGRLGGVGRVRVLGRSADGWVPLGNTLYGNRSGDRFGWAISLSANTNVLAVGAPHNDTNGRNAGQVSIFKLSSNGCVSAGVIYGEQALGEFGYAVSLSADGTRMAVGAPSHNVNGHRSGQVKIYKSMNGSWILTSIINGKQDFAQTGRSISLNASGDRIALATLNSLNATIIANVRIYEHSTCLQEITLTQTIVSGETLINEASHTITSTSKINSGANVTYTAGNKNLLQPGFHVENGAIFKAQIGGCSLSSPSNISKSEMVKHTSFSVSESEQQETMVSLYPNPTINTLTISSNLNIDFVELYNHLGSIHKKEETNSRFSKQLLLDLSSYTSGIYFLKITLINGEKVIKKVIKT